MATMTHHVIKGAYNHQYTNNIFTWYKSNFNMPVIDPVSPWHLSGSDWNVPTYGEGTSFDFSGFSPGFEAFAGFCVFYWEGPASGTTYLNIDWRDSNNKILYAYNDMEVYLNLASGEKKAYAPGCNIGICPWEINGSGTYTFGSWTTGYNATARQTTNITCTNVPSVTQLSSDKAGYIWVEDYNLCFVNATRWKHTIIGVALSDTGNMNNAGYFWYEAAINAICWIGSNGWKYRIPWSIKQFASDWTNGSTGETYAGTENAGKIWVDNEFGWTHLAFIGSDGYKYLAGAGNYPYQAP